MSLHFERSYFEWIAPMLKGAVAATTLTDFSLQKHSPMYWRNEESDVDMEMTTLGSGSFGNVWKVLYHLI
jgi:hypothetical protein